MAKIRLPDIVSGRLKLSFLRSPGAFAVVVVALVVGSVHNLISTIQARLFLQPRLQEQNDTIIRTLNQSLILGASKAYADSPGVVTPPPGPGPGLNRVPLAYNDYYNVTQDTPYYGDVSVNDLESGEHPHTYSVTQQPAYGTLTFNSTTGVFTYTPNTAYVGRDSFAYNIVDASGDRDPAVVSLVVYDKGTLPVDPWPEDPWPGDPPAGCGCGCQCSGDGDGGGDGDGDGDGDGGGDGDGDGGGCGGCGCP